METDITRLAEQYRLRTQRDGQGEMFIPCQRGQIYHHGGQTMGALVINEGKARSSPKVWGNVRRGLLAAGFTLHQNGDAEGSLLFDGHNPAMARAAIRLMKARRKRRVEVTPRLLGHLRGIRPSRSFEKVSDKWAPGDAISLASPPRVYWAGKELRNYGRSLENAPRAARPAILRGARSEI
jgi:hypothetical protein